MLRHRDDECQRFEMWLDEAYDFYRHYYACHGRAPETYEVTPQDYRTMQRWYDPMRFSDLVYRPGEGWLFCGMQIVKRDTPDNSLVVTEHIDVENVLRQAGCHGDRVKGH